MSDSKITEKLFKRKSGLSSFFQMVDVFLVDRGFHDVVDFLLENLLANKFFIFISNLNIYPSIFIQNRFFKFFNLKYFFLIFTEMENYIIL